MIAIHKHGSGFTPHWIEYCDENRIPYTLVNCYENDIIEQLKDCSALMWHHSHASSRDVQIAKSILYAMEHVGLPVFPDFRTSWHFDDKVAQKYLLDAAGLPVAKSYVFTNKSQALKWVGGAEFPKVFKLRRGACSSSVVLARTRREAAKLVRKSFGSGWPVFDRFNYFREMMHKYRTAQEGPVAFLKALYRLVRQPEPLKYLPRERGYIYFQDYMPNNDHDIRIVVIEDKAFGIKRLVRENDFRASGSGHIIHDPEAIDLKFIREAFRASLILRAQCAAFDFVTDEEGRPSLIEVSYGFVPDGYEACAGYWDSDLNWQEGKFNPYGWMVEAVRRSAGSP